MIFTLFLPKAPPEVVATIKTVFTVLLGYLHSREITAHLAVQDKQEADDELET